MTCSLHGSRSRRCPRRCSRDICSAADLSPRAAAVAAAAAAAAAAARGGGARRSRRRASPLARKTEPTHARRGCRGARSVGAALHWTTSAFLRPPSTPRSSTSQSWYRGRRGGATARSALGWYPSWFPKDLETESSVRGFIPPLYPARVRDRILCAPVRASSLLCHRQCKRKFALQSKRRRVTPGSTGTTRRDCGSALPTSCSSRASVASAPRGASAQRKSSAS